MDFDNIFSSDSKSNNNDDDFWLAERLKNGEGWSTIVEKYLRSFENLYRFEGWSNFKFCIIILSTSASIRYEIIMARVGNLRDRSVCLSKWCTKFQTNYPSLPSVLCPNINGRAITITRSTKTHKLTGKLYITCLLMVQLWCKIYILWKKSKIFTKFCKIDLHCSNYNSK